MKKITGCPCCGAEVEEEITSMEDIAKEVSKLIDPSDFRNCVSDANFYTDLACGKMSKTKKEELSKICAKTLNLKSVHFFDGKEAHWYVGTKKQLKKMGLEV